MRSFSRFIRKHLLIFISTILTILVIDVLIYVLIFQGTVHQLNNSSPKKMLPETAAGFTISEGIYDLSTEQVHILHDLNIWGMIIDSSGSVIWSCDLPDEIPLSFSPADISEFSGNYLNGYPVFTGRLDDNLLVLGYPQKSYWKITSNYLPYNMPSMTVWYVVGVFFLDVLLLFIAYTASKRQINKNINPIIDSVIKLSQGQPVKIQTKGDLAEIGNSINATSNILISKDTARANWISGVSHDIRTPLSMILGYADRIVNSSEATEQIREQADIICRQSVKIKGLIADLNLASQLEYDMQALKKEVFSLSKLIRKIAADFINNGLPDKYTVNLDVDTTHSFMMDGDQGLIKRAVENLLNNSVNHNPSGCNINISLKKRDDKACICIDDDGMGVSHDKLNAILSTPHYMNSNKSSAALQHGLGLHLVKKIIRSHEGTIKINSENGKGFHVSLYFKIAPSQPDVTNFAYLAK